MGRISKGLNRRFSLRMSDREKAIILTAQAIMAERGVKLCENDAINFLIQAGATPDPLTVTDAKAAIEQHWAVCPEGCSETPPPKCAIGVHLVRAYERVSAAEQLRYAGPSPAPAAPAPPVRAEIPAGNLSALSAAAASVAGARL